MDKKELKDFLKMSIELARTEEKIKELRIKLEKPESQFLSDMPKGGERKDFTDDIDSLIELQEFYSRWAKKLTAKQIRIETAIQSLSDSVERAVLGYRYIDGLTWEQICIKMNYSYRNVHYVHSSALKNISEIL
jgi:DNA-directed RNA polymerase specialized sigma24 family protein